MLMSWRHSGFNVFCGPKIYPRQEEAVENLARYITRASFSQERMTYIQKESKVLYHSKYGNHEKVFDALEWLKGEQMVRYYGHHSNVYRSKRKKQDQDGLIPCILDPDVGSRTYTKSWARFIKRIYEVDPLTCPKCQGLMRIISFIENEEVVKKVLKHLGL